MILPRRSWGYVLVTAAACAWGTWPLLLRMAEKVGPMSAQLEALVLMIVLTVGAMPFALFDRVKATRTWRDWAGVAWLGVADALNVALFFAAYQATTVAVAVLTHYLTPILVAALAPWALGEKTSRRSWVAAGVAFLGLVLLLEPWRGLGGRTLTGAALGAGSAVFYASNVLVNKRLVRVFSASELMVYHGFVACPLLALMVPHADFAARPEALGVVALASIGPGVLAGLAFTWGLRLVPASHASTLTLTEPLVAILLAAAVYGERLGPVSISGGLFILGGAALVVASPRTDTPAVAATPG